MIASSIMFRAYGSIRGTVYQAAVHNCATYKCNGDLAILVRNVCFDLRLRLAVVCIVLASTLTGSPCTAQLNSHDNVGGISTRAIDKRTWVPLQYDNNSIVAAGTFALPVPIVLPHHLRVLGHEALLCSESDRGKRWRNVILYFPSKDEKTIRHWIKGLPTDFPLTPKTYTITYPTPFHIAYSGVRHLNMWHFEASAKVNHRTINFAWVGNGNLPAGKPHNWYEIGGYNWWDLEHSNFSPIKNEPRLIYLVVTFHEIG